MKTVFVNIRMTQEMRDALQVIADKEQRSLSSQINYILSKSINILKVNHDTKKT